VPSAGQQGNFNLVEGVRTFPHIYGMKMLGKVLWSAAVWCGLISVVLHAAGADSLSVSLFAAVVGGLVSLEGLPEGFRPQ
jgi:hypothetical protein